MTEAEWLACTDSWPMLEFLRGKASDRKLQLFLVEYFRRNWDRLPNDRCKSGVDVLERFADGQATADELAAARRHVLDSQGQLIRARDFEGAAHAREVVDWLAPTPPYPIGGSLVAIRDIFGNPFRPVTIDSKWLSWNNGTVPAIARHVYDDRAFHDLPILADALEEAGCDNADVLRHCREPGEHVRGCWAVDLVLDKS
jgi:hypothetical protein